MQSFLEAEEIVRITNEEFIPIKRDDLTGNIDIDISISTAEDNNAKSQELSFCYRLWVIRCPCCIND